MEKYTPGPWKKDFKGTKDQYAYAIEETEIRKANSHLIAAAPELYEMGRKFYSYMAHPASFEGDHDIENLMDELNNVLKKAEGR